MIELCEATEDNPFIHGMSKQFVKALQQLFDVMDTDHSGTIKYTELASQWEEDLSDPFFPKGLIICLAKVTLPNGLLTFDRFCAGIKLCLLKNQVELKDAKEEDILVNGHETKHDNTMLTERPSSEPKIFAPPPPPPLNNSHISNEINNNTSLCNKNTSFHSSSSFNASTANSVNLSDESSKSKKLPLPSYEQVMAAKSKSISKLALDNIANCNQSIGCDDLLNSVAKFSTNSQTKNSSHYGKMSEEVRRNLNMYENFAALSNEATRYPSDNFSHRTKSMSHLENITSNSLTVQPDSPGHNETKAVNSELASVTRSTSVDPKQSNSVSSSSLARTSNQANHQPKTLSRNCILKTLQSWRDNILNKQVDSIEAKTPVGNELIAKSSFETTFPNPNSSNETTNALSASSLRRNVPKRREPRRHTVGANGIDLYAIKRFQQLEQEKDILIRGLNEIDKSKEWYMRQIANIQDKINFAGRSGSFPSDCNIDAYQERINFQAARIQNLNQHLTALREANQSFPLHMNLAIRPFNGVQRIDPNQPKQLVLNPNLVNKLKEQNRLLTDEVSRKSDRITQLEREKSSLIRELFQARTYSSYYNGDFDDTFM